jgi:hypothetical protein
VDVKTLTLGNKIGGGRDSWGSYICTGENEGEEWSGVEWSEVVMEQMDVPLQITDLILYHDSHSEHTQFAVTCLGKQSIIPGYN